MCELTTMLMIGSTVMGAAGAVQQGKAANASAQYNAKVADMNAKLSERQARDAVARGAGIDAAEAHAVIRHRQAERRAIAAGRDREGAGCAPRLEAVAHGVLGDRL